MPYIYENDVTRSFKNLQTTVGYLVSLHKNEYQWNLLGIKVVGHVDALPIPDGTYEYGDAYTVGAAAPYDMWIYTRADETHAQDYWFNIGKFPAPGPQGPAGPSLVDVTKFEMGTIQKVYYDATFGADVTGTAKLTYKDPNTGETKTDTIDDFSIRLPLFGAGDYITVDANAAEDGVDVKLDDTQLALDFWKVNKTSVNSAPIWVASAGGFTDYAATTSSPDSGTFAYRDSSGSCGFHNLNLRNALTDGGGGSVSYADQICECANPTYSEKVIAKTSTDTGTLDASVLNDLKAYPQLHIIYDNQLYYRQDPLAAPDGTMNFIHIDAVQDGSGGYTATGKCFSITVSTRAWQVVSMDFVASVRARHNLKFTDLVTNDTIDVVIINANGNTYTNKAADAIQEIIRISAAETLIGFYSATGNTAYKTVEVTGGGDNYLSIIDPSDFSKQYTEAQLQVEDHITIL